MKWFKNKREKPNLWDEGVRIVEENLHKINSIVKEIANTMFPILNKAKISNNTANNVLNETKKLFKVLHPKKDEDEVLDAKDFILI